MGLSRAISKHLLRLSEELPKVRWVLPDSYLDVQNKDYGGESFINGQAVPYDPKSQEEWIRNNAGANERNRCNDKPQNFDRTRKFERKRENMRSRDFQYPSMNQPMQNTGPNMGVAPPNNKPPNFGGVPPRSYGGKSPWDHQFALNHNLRFYRTIKASQNGQCENSKGIPTVSGENGSRISRATMKEAQVALLEYLHSSRGIQFMDAENMSKNSPIFLQKLLGKVENEGEIGWSIARFLRYHPINEFEPFFESMGLQPVEYNSFLPRDLMFLSDDDLLLENYHALCNYGIERNKIGKIYKEATEIFRYEYGVLLSKLRAYEALGLSQSMVIKFIVCIPYLLIEDVNEGFVKVLGKLKGFGLQSSWVEEQLIDGTYYNWKQILGLLCWFQRMGCSDEKLGCLVSQHPNILFEDSGSQSLSLIGLLLKIGSSMNPIHSMFLQFPRIKVRNFVSNLRRCLLFFNEIDMSVQEIGKIVRSHPLLLGSCTLKKTSSLCTLLRVRKKRLCELIQKNPQELKNWKLGTKVPPLPARVDFQRSKQQKIQFLLRLGLQENSFEMKQAFKVFRGKGAELQERFDCIVKAGIDEKDVYKMIRACPQILNQSKDILEAKIDFLVNDLRYPVSLLVKFPSYFTFTTERITLRFSMYNWLMDQGIANGTRELSTIVPLTENTFLKRYVNRYPKGLEVWQNLKSEIYSDYVASPAY